MTNLQAKSGFDHVNTWVFDLDNTLYPRRSNLFSQIDVKMTSYVAQLLGLPRDAARKVQKQYYLEHGTTLKGLMLEHRVDYRDFLDKVHDIDYSWLDPDPALGTAIEACRGASIFSPMATGAMPSARRDSSAFLTGSTIFLTLWRRS